MYSTKKGMQTVTFETNIKDYRVSDFDVQE